MAQTHSGAMLTAAKRAGLPLADFLGRLARGLKLCIKCREWKQANVDFGADRTRYDGRASRCLGCNRVKVRVTTKGRVSAFRGRSHTPAAKEAMRARKVGRPSARLGIRHTDESRRKMSATQTLIAKRGPAHHAWKGGVAEGQKRDRKSPGYSSWRGEVRRRAGGHCEACQCKRGKGRMDAHHILGFAKHPALRLDPDNGVWLCDDCHDSIHAIVITPAELAAGEVGVLR